MNTISYKYIDDTANKPALNQHYINQYDNNGTHIHNFKQYLTSLGPIPEPSSYLGTCDDGLPLLIDLGDASTGNLLIIGDEQKNCIPFLRNLLAASISLNHSNSLEISIITPNLGHFLDLCDSNHIHSLMSSFETVAHSHVIELAILAEQRRNGRHIGPTHLLIIDNLTELIKYNDFETANHLSWLIKNGARNSIWVIASLSNKLFQKADKKILSCFGTYIFSEMTQGFSQFFNHSPNNQIDRYSTRIGNETIKFYLPMQV